MKITLGFLRMYLKAQMHIMKYLQIVQYTFKTAFQQIMQMVLQKRASIY